MRYPGRSGQNIEPGKGNRPVRDGQTFAETAQRAARLALTIIRENGWQPSGMGGRGLFDRLIMDKGNYMLLGAAIAPGGRSWEGNLKAFFAVPPSAGCHSDP
jgi:hypothetical protein